MKNSLMLVYVFFTVTVFVIGLQIGIHHGRELEQNENVVRSAEDYR